MNLARELKWMAVVARAKFYLFPHGDSFAAKSGAIRSKLFRQKIGTELLATSDSFWVHVAVYGSENRREKSRANFPIEKSYSNSLSPGAIRRVAS